MSDRLHFTAWLVNDSTCLDQGCMDVTILQDQQIAADPEDHGNWATDSSKDAAFYAVTTVDAAEGDAGDGIAEAEELMESAGWRVAPGVEWEAAPNAHFVPVERS